MSPACRIHIMGATQDVGMDLTLQKTLFSLSSSLTERFPRAGARFLDTALVPLLAHPWMEAGFRHRNRAVLDRVSELRKVLVLADVHLGDALMLEGLVLAIRDFFPAAEIHYVVSRHSQPFLEGHPDVSHLWPVYTGSPLPSERDVAAVRELIAKGGYDLVVNACPSFVPGRPLPEREAVLDFVTHAPRQNITCLNKLHKTCRIPRCFEGCSPLSVADTVLARLRDIQSLGTSHPRRIVA